MTPPTLSDSLADLAHHLRTQIDQIFAAVETTAPAQRDRLSTWLERCVAQDAAAGTEEALAAALRDIVTLRNGQLGFTVSPSRPGMRREAVITADLGGAVPLGQAVVALLRAVAVHHPDLALRLIREVRATDMRQRAAIARAIGWR